MCGIFGSSNYEKLKTLYNLNKERGSFAYGYLYRDGQDRFLIQKGQGNVMPSSIIDEEDFNYYLGHTQGPTSSERTFTEETSHPFSYGRWAVAHNGVLSNYKELYTNNNCVVDSSVIPYLLNNSKKEDVVDIISETCSQLEGTFSCWLFDSKENDIYIVRCGSTLFYNKDGDISSKKPDDSWATIKEGDIYKLIDNNFVSVGTFKTKSPYFIL
jgi:glucosamine 6-phosphate synthetase-like amidotransferase/phosphosugar isomerase protein